MKARVWALLALALVSLGWCAMDRQYEKGLRAAQEEGYRRAADSAQARATRDSLRVVQADARADFAIASLDSLRRAERERGEKARQDEARAVERVAEAGRTLDATLDSLQASVTPPLVPLVRDARSQLRTEREAHASVAAALHLQMQATATELAAADSALSLRSLQVIARDSLIVSLRESVSAKDDVIAAMEATRDSGPGRLERLLWDAAKIGGGYLLGRLSP